MHQIDDLIFIGDAQDAKRVNKDRIDAILNLAKEVNDPEIEGIEHVKVPLTDDGVNDCVRINQAVEELARLQGGKKRTLVHCHSGRSRAPGIVAKYFHKYQGWSLDSAIEAIQAKRPIADPGEPFWQNLLMCSMESDPH
jgi:atypical dual specificity phosphatase